MRIFSGIQPTGILHIGNYFGAVRRWVELQETAECLYCVVDYHALTSETARPEELSGAWRELVLDLMACGIDPQRSILFRQSHVPEHTELCWILSCLTSFGDLARMTQFKEKARGQEFVNVGLFIYPVLQAADILLYRADHVPVGEDQVQHLELARRIARRFNGRYGEVFPEPEPLVGAGARIMSLADPGRKMSKSAGPGHVVGLFDPEDEIRAKLRTAVTDTGLAPGQDMSPGVANLFRLLELVAPDEVVRGFKGDHAAGRLMYRNLKASLQEHLLATLAPLQERRRELAATVDVEAVLEDGAERARGIARPVIAEVRARVGL